MNHFFISGQLIAITWFALGIFVFLKDRKNPTNRFFALFSFSVAIYGFGFAQQGIATEKEASLFWIRIIMFGTTFIPIFFIQFIYSILNKKLDFKQLITIYSIGILFEFTNFFTELLVKDPVPKFGFKYLFQAGVMYPVFSLFFAILVAVALYNLYSVYQKISGLKHNQLKWLFWASLIGFIGGSNGFMLGYDINTYPLNPFASYGPSIFGILIASTIVRYQLMDISIVLKKGLSYSALLALVLVPLYLLTLFMQNLFHGSINTPFSIVMLLLFVVAAVVLYRVKAAIEQRVEKTLFRSRYDANKILRKFTDELITITDFKELLNSIIKTFVTTLKIDKASIVLFDEDIKRFRMHSSHGLKEGLVKKISLKEDDHFIAWLKGKGKIVITEELERFTAENKDIKKTWDALRLMESELCMPFIYKGEMVGFLNLGAKGDRSMYNHEDIELFLSLGKQAAIAIKNAQLIEKIKESKQVIRRMERLKTIGDMAAGMAHEIRNPLVPIKTCLELLPERYGVDKEFTERIPRAALQEVERIEALLKEIMDYSRPRSPVFKETDINDIAEKTVTFVEYEAKKKGIKIKREFDATLPLIKVDGEQIKQVLLNLIINAIDAVNGNGRISIKTCKASHIISPCGKNGKGEYVQIEVTDNGAGIPQENLERIFNPFYTTKHESKEREGTGLGLAIVQEIVTEHCGFIQVKSELGKGSAFLVNLPIDCSEFAKIAERRKVM